MSAARYLPIGRREPHDHGISPTETLLGALIGLVLVVFASTRVVLAARRLVRARTTTRTSAPIWPAVTT